MKYEKFKQKIIKGLQKIYGDGAEIDTGVVIKNNGSKYNGIMVRMKDSECRTAPVIELDGIYEAFESGIKDMEDCVREVYSRREDLKYREEIEYLAERAREWELVKDRIYPMLFSTEENRELLENLVSVPMLDLSVIYVIRGESLGESTMSIKVSKGLLKYYGISSEQLHRQAMMNLEKDGYEFQELRSVVMKILHIQVSEEGQDNGCHEPEMYILTNSTRSYGAAGILNEKLLREFAGGRDFIILPSSIHETLFVPVNGEPDQEYFDNMVKEVNRSVLSVEERLADHSYYYDAGNGEIRMCA